MHGADAPFSPAALVEAPDGPPFEIVAMRHA